MTAAAFQPRRFEEQRVRDFFERYEHLIIPEPNSGCWLWNGGAISPRNSADVGYGLITVSQKKVYVHRCAFEAVHGDGSADGYMVRHKCDIPLCVNPDHLLLGTNQDNMRDMRERGRSNKGSKNGSSTLQQHQIAEIIAMRASGRTQSAIAEAFCITQSAVSLITNGKRWNK